MTTILAVLQAIIALPKIGELFERAITAIVVARQEARRVEQRKAVEEAALATKNAKTKEERREALKKWRGSFGS